MPDYKSMYYHLAGRTATAVDVLETTLDMMTANAKALSSSIEAMSSSIDALVVLKEKLKLAQQITEDLFIDPTDDSEEEESNT